jgi:RNA polymerase sigma-70 factor (ECF subfamily)
MSSTEQTALLADEEGLLRALRRRDEEAFAELVDTYSPALLRLAMTYVRTADVAEEVVQETWLGVIRGLEGFEGRSSLKSWIFTILKNTAISRGERERRSIPMSSLVPEDDGPLLDPDRFLPPDHARYPGHWAIGPASWPIPEEGLLAGETREVIARAIRELPPVQRAVIALRDVEGWPPDEVCEALEVSEVNQRVLLHRGRTKVRAALERYFGAVEPTLAEGGPRGEAIA